MAKPVFDHVAESRQKPRALGGFAVQQRDLFGIFAHANQVETEIGLVALLLEIEADQRPADPDASAWSRDCVDQRAPYQVAGDRDVLAEQMQRRLAADRPHRMTTNETSVTTEFNSPSDLQRLLDEALDVVGDALVRVVGGIAEQLHPVVIGVVQPVAEIAGPSSSAASGSAATG